MNNYNRNGRPVQQNKRMPVSSSSRNGHRPNMQNNRNYRNNQNDRNYPVRRSESKKTFSLSKMITELMPMIKYDKEAVKTVKVKEKKPFPLSAVVIVAICTALLMFMVISYVQINEYTVEVANLRGELSEMTAERKELTLQLEKKNDMLEIEKYATENLGMVKADQLTKKHISLSHEDKIEVVESEPGEDLTVVSGVMSAFAQNFRGFWEYME